ncbi:uncharacterized protein LOC112257020 [Oncorhynchus tshawytscha]|uniref:uncharacterized protein LOC112257020 n=1 Tax=Oncorhynchus tshawytscha TaxID=74940 RepID=UPI000D09F01A|nr:uncharacterized protein LOC112257020 [Oncorhynchus tshawytscha]
MISEADRQGAVRPKRSPSDRHRDRDRDRDFSPRRRSEADQHYLQERHQEGINDLPAGKRQMMEKFFTPVHSPPPGGITSQKHRHHQDQEREIHSYRMSRDNDRRSSERHVHHHHRGNHFQDDQEQCHRRHHHHPQHLHHDDEMSDHHTTVTLSRASSSSLSSSDSSDSDSSIEWSGIDDKFSLKHASRPQHTMSCSNIAGGRQFREDDSELQVYATVKQGQLHGGGSPGTNHRAQGRGGQEPSYSELNRGHSRSEEGLLQNTGTDRGKARTPPHLKHGPLYKTASLGRSLAFSEEVLAGPKRAVSSIQLPSKGILKNKEAPPDIRKAKSMEVLSPRVAGKTAGPKGKQDVEALKDAARQSMVKGKIQFSAFLDEITKQVISPARLNTLGVPVETVGPGPAKTPASPKSQLKSQPQLPLKKQGDGQGEERETVTKPRKLRNDSDTRSRKISLPTKFGYESKNHTPRLGSPPTRHSSQPYPPHPPAGYEDQPASLPDFQGPVGNRHGRYGSLLTDGTVSSSPEPSHQKHRSYKHLDQSHRSTHSPPSSPHTQQPQLSHRTPIRTHSPPPVPGPESESPSSKSDSSRNRDRDTASPSSEQSDRHNRSTYRWRPKPHRALTGDKGELQALQEENAELHQNLMQTVVCIESLEAELARAREELSHMKEKFKRLQDTHTGTQHTNSLLGEKLHSATESLSSERKYMVQRIAHLSTELEQANATIASLENINVPCLIKELIEKHFDSGDTVKQFLKNTLKTGQSISDIQSPATKLEQKPSDWSGAGLRECEAGPQKVTAFMPWKQEEGFGVIGQTGNEDSRPMSPPFSVADISMAIYKKLAASQAARQPRPSNLQPHTDTPPNPYPLVELGTGGAEGAWEEGYLVPAVKGGVAAAGRAAESKQGAVVDVSYLTAQRVLDDFMHQLTHPEDGSGGGERGHKANGGGGTAEERGAE